MEPDQLFTLRNLFYLGNFREAIREAKSLNRLGESQRIERDCFLYRSHISQGDFGVALDEIQDQSGTALSSVKLFATYVSSEDNREIAVMTLKEWLNDPSTANNPMLQTIAGIIFCREGNFKEALQAARRCTTIEMQALTVQIYLKMDRIDLAEKQLRQMQQTDEDSTLTQLATAWVNLSTGGPKYQEAAYIYQELMDKFETTPFILNGLSVAQMNLKRFSDAESNLLEAYEMNASNCDTLQNLIVCAEHLGKAQDVEKYVAALARVDPEHPWLVSVAAIESAFDRAQTQFAN